MKVNKKTLLRRSLPVIIGALAGYAYYYFIGCTTGHCPIQSSPYFSTLYGALAGSIFAFPGRNNQNKKENLSNGE